MPVFNNMLAGASGGAGGGYAIERSLRFNSGDSAKLSRTPSSAGNRKTWTWSGWFKRGDLSRTQALFSAYTSSSYGEIYLSSPDNIKIVSNLGTHFISNAVFRDTSAWYHLVVACDTTQSSANDRLKVYVNGSEISKASGSVTQDAQLGFNNTIGHYIGSFTGSNEFLSGYLADVQFIDGQALAPTDFGETDDNGVWQPKKFAGTYGTNGFHLDFKDNSSNAALGTDTSGNSNTWTVNNLTAFAGDYSGTATGYITTPLNALDGNLSTAASAFPAGNSGDYVFNNAITITGTLKVYTVNGSGTGHPGGSAVSVRVDGTWTVVNSLSNSYSSDLSGLGSSFQGFRVYAAAGNGSPGLMGIEANGALLVNGPADTDSLVDSPTNGTQTDSGAGGEVVGNYAVINPLDNPGEAPYGNQGATITNGNLDFAATGGFYALRRATVQMPSSGKWYMECTVNGTGYSPRGVSSQSSGFGLCKSNVITDGGAPITDGDTLWLGDSGYGKLFGSTTRTEWKAADIDEGDIISLAVDMDASTFNFRVNNVSVQNGSINTTDAITPFVFSSSTSYTNLSVNFGQRAFAYTAPTGFKTLNTANLPEPTIADGSLYFDTKLYTGNSGTQQITGYNFSPDFLWIKSRTNPATGHFHHLHDSVRGLSSGFYKNLYSNTTEAENTYPGSTYGGVNSLNSDGFSLANVGSNYNLNNNTTPYVAWAWDAGTSTVTNNDGSIASQVRANPSAGFSIVGWDNSLATAKTVGHGLNAAPELIFTKSRGSARSDDWQTYHVGIGNAKKLNLNGTNGTVSSSMWQSTTPTSSVFNVNDNDQYDWIAYCFAPVAGYSAIGSYQNPSSSDGAFVHLGFRPAFLLIKCAENISSSSGTGDWIIKDETRSPFNIPSDGNTLVANVSAAEDSHYSASQAAIDILSNGFKIRHPNSSPAGDTGRLYIYYAVAENPFKTARAR